MRVAQIDSLHQKCTGCHACAQSCKLSAIQMVYSGDGFLYPQINKKLCVNCGICYRVCPLNVEKTITPILESYSGYAKDADVVAASSSGGVFYYLARRILQENGVIIGAAFDPVEKEVRHMSTDQVPLKRLMRSKYVQSRIGNAYAEAEAALKANRKVLFVGTPCQVRGLRNYLGEKAVTGNLETVDFMCHGVPSATFFQEFLRSLERKYGSQIRDVTFREKDKGWHTQVTKVYFANGRTWRRNSLQHYYYYYFLNDYSLRDSCYECAEYHSHTSDLTLADDWVSNAEKNKMGSSLIFVNTANGQNMLEHIYDSMVLMPVRMNDFSIYSHEKYNMSKKAQWLEAWKNRGFNYAAGTYYRKVSGMKQLRQYIQNCASYVKRNVTAILFRRS